MEDRTNGKATDPANGDITSPIHGVKFNHLQTEYQVFPEEYFSGCDTTVYFGDIFVDTITGLEFTLQEQVRPLYGYADYTWSEISRGNRIVQGTFRIAFKEAGYLFVILDHIAQLAEKAQPALGYLMTNQQVPDWHASARQTLENLLDYYVDQAYTETQPIYTTTSKNVTTNYDWPTMGIGSTDSNSPSAMAKKAGFKGAVSQLQKLLIDKGFGIPSAQDEGIGTDAMVGLKQRYWDGEKWEAAPADGHSGPHADYAFYGVNGNWPSKGRPSKPMGGDYYSDLEANLERRLYHYVFLQDHKIQMSDRGNGKQVDGKFGDLVRHGVALFQRFSEYIPNSSPPSGAEVEKVGYTGFRDSTWHSGWGGWVDRGTADRLYIGTHVNGNYDVATKAAVYNFQKKYQNQTVKWVDGKTYTVQPNGNCDTATVAMLSKVYNTNAVSQTVKTGEKTVTVGHTPETGYANKIAQYEREIWGRPFGGDDGHNRRTFFYDGGMYMTAINGQSQLPKLKKTGFDIYITYGPIGIWALQNVNPNNKSTYDGALPTDQNGGSAPFQNTVHAIRNVQLASLGQAMAPDGSTIEEVYMFVARDLD